MVVDTSALMAILLQETDAAVYLEEITQAGEVCLSAATLVELYIVAISRSGPLAVPKVDLLLAQCNAEVIPLEGVQIELARDAFLTYGKGRSRAALNFGDCFSYALAKSRGEPLLYKG